MKIAFLHNVYKRFSETAFMIKKQLTKTFYMTKSVKFNTKFYDFIVFNRIWTAAGDTLCIGVTVYIAKSK